MGKYFSNVIQWYEDNAKTYAKASEDLVNKELINRFIEYLKNGSKVLDAGCGPGRDSKVFYDLGFNIFGVDLSSNLLKIASQKCPQGIFKKADFLSLPFNDKYFDGIWASASLLHLENISDVEKALSEFNRVLKKDGILCVLVKQQMGKEKTSIVTDSLSNHDRFFQWFSKIEIKKLLKKSNFSIVSLEDNYPDLAGRKEVKWIVGLAKKN